MLVLLVELLAIVLASVPGSANFWDQFAFISMLMLWTGLLNAAALCKTRHWLNSLSPHKSIVLSFFLMMLISFVVATAASFTNDFLMLDSQISPLGEYFLTRILLISAAIYAVTLRYFYVQQQWKIHIQAQSKAEIQALRARIRPHFLFNSMNTIASLISFKPDMAEKAVVDLSDLFRASLCDKNANTLADELKLTRSYLDIETLRLGNRLNINWEIDQQLADIEVPTLCLQPLVENAIYHGVEPLTTGGVISISAQKKNDALILSIANPLGNGEISTHQGNHMAQENIRQRLNLLYGDLAAFTIQHDNETYRVTLKIPLETKSI